MGGSEITLSDIFSELGLDFLSDVGVQDTVMAAGIEQRDELKLGSLRDKLDVDPRQRLADLRTLIKISGGTRSKGFSGGKDENVVKITQRDVPGDAW